MTTENTAGKIFQAIPKIIEEMRAVGKSGKNKDQGYDYRKVDDIYDALSPLLGKHGVFISPHNIEVTATEITSKSGSRGWHVIAKVLYRAYATDGSFIEPRGEGESQEYGDKGRNKAIIAAFKYMLIQLFCIATKDLPDADATTPEPVAPGSQPQNKSSGPPKSTSTATPPGAKNMAPADQVQFKRIMGLAQDRQIQPSDLDLYVSTCYPGGSKVMKRFEAEEIISLLEDESTTVETLIALCEKRINDGYRNASAAQ